MRSFWDRLGIVLDTSPKKLPKRETQNSIFETSEGFRKQLGGAWASWAPGQPLRKSRCQKYCVLQCLSPRPPISPQSGEGRKHKVPIFTIENGAANTDPPPWISYSSPPGPLQQSCLGNYQIIIISKGQRSNNKNDK